MQNLPSMKNLQVFSSAAETLSFTATAVQLGMTQPAVSQSIKQLEKHLGLILFIREHRVLRLSPAGEKFKQDVGVGLSHIEQSINTMQATEASDQRVTLSISTAFATHWLLPRVARFKAEHPDIDLRFQTTSHDIDLGSAGIAMAVRHGNGDFPGYRSWRMFDEEVVPICSPAYLQGRQIEYPEELLSYPLIHLDEPHRTRLNWSAWFRHLGMEFKLPDSGLQLNDYAIVLQTAIEGQGIALGWRYIVKRLFDNGQLVQACPQSVDTGKGFYLVAPLGVPMTARGCVVRDWLLRQVGGR